MSYLSETHQQLSESQRSGLLSQFAALRFDHRMMAIGLSATIGLTCGALAWTGQASDRVYFCYAQPDQSLKCEGDNNRPFRMTPFHWQEWKRQGMPTQVAPNPSIGNSQGIVPANNPHKPILALGAFLGFAAAGWMLRHLQHEESQLAPLEAIAQQRDQAVADMASRAAVVNAYRQVAVTQAEVEAEVQFIQHEALIRMEQAQALGEAEIGIAKLEASEALFEAETAGLTPEQRKEYAEFMRSVQTPYLPGTQTLNGITTPTDKLDESANGSTLQSAKTGDELEFDITRLNPTDPTKGKNIAIVAGQGVGKTTLALYIAGEILQSPDIQVYDLDDDGKTWGNLPVWGQGDDSSEIAGAMQADKELFEERTQQRIEGDRFPFAVRILDEVPSTVQVIPKQFAEWAFMMTSRARKRGLIAILLTQFRDPELNGIKPDQWRTSFVTFYLGFKQVSHALNYLVKPKDVADRLRDSLDRCKRPCLVAFEDGWYWFDVPELEEWRTQFLKKTQGRINPSSDTQLGIKLPPVTPETMGSSDRQRLEFLLNLPSEKPTEKSPEDLTDRQVAILQYAANKLDWINASELQANLRDCRGVSAKDIAADFEVLSRNGFGKSDTSGRTTRWIYTLV